MKLSCLLFLALARPGFSETLQAGEDDHPSVRKLNRHRHHHHHRSQHRAHHESQAEIPNLRSKPRVNDISQGTLRAPVQGKNSRCKHGGSGTEDDPCIADVIVVGAGAAGVSAAALLKRYEFTVIVLEASPGTASPTSADDYGTKNGYGRARAGLTSKFGLGAGAKIDIGGEWVHTEARTHDDVAGGFTSPSVLLRTALEGVNDNPSKDFTSKLIDDCADQPGKQGIGDHRWKDYTWWDFIHDEIVTNNGLDGFINRDQIVNYIYKSTSNEYIYAHSAASDEDTVYMSTAVIVTVPINKLQSMTYEPDLPSTLKSAIGQYTMGNGIKAWLQFAQYVEPFGIIDKNDNPADGAIGDGSMFFDEMTGHPSDSERTDIVGFFAHGHMANGYVSKSDAALQADLVQTLRNKRGASNVPDPTNVFVINWSKEPFIETGYTLTTNEDAIKELQLSYHDGRLFFAGEGIPASGKPSDVGFMNGAINSGKKAAKAADKFYCNQFPSECD